MSYKENPLEFIKVFLEFKENFNKYKKYHTTLFRDVYMRDELYNQIDHLTPFKKLFYTSNKTYLKHQSVKLVNRFDISTSDFRDYSNFIFELKGNGEVEAKYEKDFLKYLDSLVKPPEKTIKQLSEKELKVFYKKLSKAVKKEKKHPHLKKEEYIEVQYILIKNPFSYSYFRKLYFIEQRE